MLELNLNNGENIKITDDNQVVVSDNLKKHLKTLKDENGKEIPIKD